MYTVTIYLSLSLEDPPVDTYDLTTNNVRSAVKKYVTAFADDLADAVEDLDVHFTVNGVKAELVDD